jgi:hypothetical protein
MLVTSGLLQDRASLLFTGVATAKYLTAQPRGLVHSGATVLDSHQLPHAVTQSERNLTPGISSIE